MERQIVSTDHAPKPPANYSQAVKAGGLVFVSGQGPFDPKTGEVHEQLEMPAGVNVSGLESDGHERFFCGGGKSGKVRVVRRPKRASTA